MAPGSPLVIYVDDAQWGDADSAALLLELVRPPDAPPVLFVMTHRDEEAKASPFLKEMRNRWPEGAEMRDITVGPLDARTPGGSPWRCSTDPTTWRSARPVRPRASLEEVRFSSKSWCVTT